MNILIAEQFLQLVILLNIGGKNNSQQSKSYI